MNLSDHAAAAAPASIDSRASASSISASKTSKIRLTCSRPSVSGLMTAPWFYGTRRSASLACCSTPSSAEPPPTAASTSVRPEAERRTTSPSSPRRPTSTTRETPSNGSSPTTEVDLPAIVRRRELAEAAPPPMTAQERLDAAQAAFFNAKARSAPAREVLDEAKKELTAAESKVPGLKAELRAARPWERHAVRRYLAGASRRCSSISSGQSPR